MLDIAARNIATWFPGSIQMTPYVRNFIEEPLDDIFASQMLDDSRRIILVLGDTLDNEPSPVAALRTISQYIRPGDLLLYDVLTPTDTPSSSTTFTLSPRHTYLLDLLGITSNLYESKRSYDATTHTRLDQIVPLDDISLTYDIGGARNLVLRRDKAITIWRYHSSTPDEAAEHIRQSGLQLLAPSNANSKRQLPLLCERAS